VLPVPFKAETLREKRLKPVLGRFCVFFCTELSKPLLRFSG